jgi:hypothetical protein
MEYKIFNTYLLIIEKSKIYKEREDVNHTLTKTPEPIEILIYVFTRIKHIHNRMYAAFDIN